jgi:hypothetical protein
MWECENVGMRECENEIMRKCKNGRIPEFRIASVGV